MDAPGTIDPEIFLQPLGDDTPAGTDPRADTSLDSRFLRIKDSRAEARRIERANDVDGDSGNPQTLWSEVANLAAEILTEEGKDLEVAAWLVEALVRLDGFAGLHSGLKVASGLVNRFWDGIYPLPDEDGQEPRLLPFLNLNGADGQGTLIQPLRKIEITEGDPPYAFWQYTQANEIAQIADSGKRDARIAAGGLALDAFTASVQQTSPKFYGALLAEMQASLDALNELSDAFSQHVGNDAPPAGAIRSTLAAIQDAVKLFAAEKIAQAAAEESSGSAAVADEAVDVTEEAEEGTGASGPGVSRGALVNREDALRQLLRIAAFFREHEPHSPISYTIEEMVRRARMPLNELLDELIIDGDARRYFYIAAGLKPPASE